jgi:antirestriction protein ArdC
MDQAMADIAAAVADLASGEDWQAWLRLSARLARRRRYSAQNTIWLWQQARARGVELSTVGGDRWWQSLGRQVRRGEHAFHVLAPVSRTAADPDRPDDPDATVRRLVGWRIESVFDQGQTDGEPLPEPPAVVLPAGDGPAGAWDALAALLDAGGWTVEREPIAGATQGYTEWATRRVVVRADLAGAAAAYVLAHETAHTHLHEQCDQPRPVKEIEADSTAYLIADALGLDTSTATFAYIAGWADGNPDAVLAVAARAATAATAILAALTPPADQSAPTAAA